MSRLIALHRMVEVDRCTVWDVTALEAKLQLIYRLSERSFYEDTPDLVFEMFISAGDDENQVFYEDHQYRMDVHVESGEVSFWEHS